MGIFFRERAAQHFIRKAEPDDEAGVVALWHACRLVADNYDANRDFAVSLTQAATILMIAVSPAHAVIASAMAEHDGRQGVMWYVAVAPAHRQQGVGRRIVAACEKWLKTNRIGSVKLMLAWNDIDAVRFYRRMGYELAAPDLMRKVLSD